MSKNEKALEKLQSIVKPDPGTWKKEAQWRHENKTWLRKSQKIAFKILRTLREQKKTQKELAGIMNVSPQQVNKWVKGKENFTLETLSRLEEALEINLLVIDNSDKTNPGNDKQGLHDYSSFSKKPSEIDKTVDIITKEELFDRWTLFEIKKNASKVIELNPESKYKKRINLDDLFVAEPDEEYY